MHPARRCTNCNETATKFLGMIVLDPFIPTELDRMEGYFCNNCFSRRLNAYAMDSITSPPKPSKRWFTCKYCYRTYPDPGVLQTHQDLMHSNENEAGTTVLEDPAVRAQEILNEDSKRWAAEYVTPPLDTPPEKAKKLRDQLRDLNERLDRGDHARRRIDMAKQQDKEFYEGVNKKYQEGHYEYVGEKKAKGLLKKRGRPKKK